MVLPGTQEGQNFCPGEGDLVLSDSISRLVAYKHKNKRQRAERTNIMGIDSPKYAAVGRKVFPPNSYSHVENVGIKSNTPYPLRIRTRRTTTRSEKLQMRINDQKLLDKASPS